METNEFNKLQSFINKFIQLKKIKPSPEKHSPERAEPPTQQLAEQAAGQAAERLPEQATALATNQAANQAANQATKQSAERPTNDSINHAVEKINAWDLSSDEDLSVAVMNLIGIEEHLFFSGAKTGKNEYYDLIREVRDIRKDLLKKLIPEYEGEVWCISKHLLAAGYRLMEVGAKLLDLGKKEEAYSFFNKAYSLYSLFWGVKLKVISTENLTKIDDEALSKQDADKKGVLDKLKNIVRKVVDCCIE